MASSARDRADVIAVLDRCVVLAEPERKARETT